MFLIQNLQRTDEEEKIRGISSEQKCLVIIIGIYVLADFYLFYIQRIPVMLFAMMFTFGFILFVVVLLYSHFETFGIKIGPQGFEMNGKLKPLEAKSRSIDDTPKSEINPKVPATDSDQP